MNRRERTPRAARPTAEAVRPVGPGTGLSSGRRQGQPASTGQHGQARSPAGEAFGSARPFQRVAVRAGRSQTQRPAPVPSLLLGSPTHPNTVGQPHDPRFQIPWHRPILSVRSVAGGEGRPRQIAPGCGADDSIGRFRVQADQSRRPRPIRRCPDVGTITRSEQSAFRTPSERRTNGPKDGRVGPSVRGDRRVRLLA